MSEIVPAAPVQIVAERHRPRRKRGRSAFGQVLLRRRAGARRGVWYVRYRDLEGGERWEAIEADPEIRGVPLDEEGRRWLTTERVRIRKCAENRLAEIRLGLARAEKKAPGVRAVTFADFWRTVESAFRTGRPDIGLRAHAPDTLAGDEPRYRVVAGYFGSRALAEIGGAEVSALLAWLRTERKVAGPTLNRYVALLGAVYRVALAERPACARENPVRGIKYEREPEPDVPLLRREDLDRLLAHVRGEAWAPVALLAETGCRRSEITRATWADVDLDGATLFIRRSKTGESRVVPLTPRAVEILSRLREARHKVSLAGTDAIFPEIGEQSRWRLTQAFKAAARAVGLGGLSLHALRHNFASTLRQHGTAAPDVGRLIGDKTPRVIERYSRHAPEGAGKAAIYRLAQAWGQVQEPARKVSGGGGLT